MLLTELELLLAEYGITGVRPDYIKMENFKTQLKEASSDELKNKSFVSVSEYAAEIFKKSANYLPATCLHSTTKRPKSQNMVVVSTTTNAIGYYKVLGFAKDAEKDEIKKA